MAMGGKRRSLLNSAIESLEAAAPVAAPADADFGDALADLELPDEGDAAPTHPSFLARRAQSLGEVSRTVKRPTIRLKPNECTI